MLCNKYCVAALILVIIISGCHIRPTHRASAEYSEYISYHEIPGVSAEEIDAIELIKAKRDSFVYAMNYSTEAFWNEDMSIGGYTALFCEWLSGLFGIPFVPKIAEWDDLINGLEAKTIDFSGELTATDERLDTYFMTSAIAMRSIKVMRIAGSEPLLSLGKSRTPRFVFLDGATTQGLVAHHLTFDFETLYIGDYESAYRLLKDGIADAFFDEDTAEAAFETHPEISAEVFFPLIYGPVSLSTQNSELAPVISVVQKALDSGAVFYLRKLYNQGYQDYIRRKLYLQLTPEEKEYILLHNTPETAVKFAAEFDNYPASFYNRHDKEWQGVCFDVLHEIERFTGLCFTVAHDTHAEWPDIFRMLEDGDVSMVSELLWVEDREGRFLWADDPYQHDFYALLSSADYENININEVFYSRVGLIIDSGYADMFNEWFSGHTNTVEYNTTIDALNGLITGELDLVMASKNQILAVTNYLERPGYKVNYVFNYPSDSYLGFNINEPVLCSIVSKSQKMINTLEIFNRWERKIFDYRRKMAQAQLPWLIGAAVLLFCVLALVFAMLQRNKREGRRLERLVRERTRALEAATDTALAASRTKSEFLANMSHEIRTPINAVTGMTMIARSSKDLNRIYDCLDKISAASKQLLGLINDILDMSKIEARKFELVHEPFALEAMVRNIGSIISVRTTEKNQKFIIDLSPDIPQVVIGDEMRFSQILINLLSNAVKFTPENGEIRFTLKRTGSREGKEVIESSVSDTGIGITMEQQQRLFTAFTQADSGTSKRFGGTGLGLAISKSLAELMGGDIAVKSNPGEGSCFTVHVLLEPGSRDMLEASQAGKIPSDFNFDGRIVLLVEDIPINREIVIALLEDTNVTLDCAENGEIAVNMFKAAPERYDLVFMDLQMPVMDGYTATRAIRAFETEMRKKQADKFSGENSGMTAKWQQGVPIIAMTANAFAEDVEKCKKAGMNDHISKPVEVEALLNVANKYLTREYNHGS